MKFDRAFPHNPLGNSSRAAAINGAAVSPIPFTALEDVLRRGELTAARPARPFMGAPPSNDGDSGCGEPFFKTVTHTNVRTRII